MCVIVTWQSKFETGLPLSNDIRKYPEIITGFTVVYGE